MLIAGMDFLVTGFYIMLIAPKMASPSFGDPIDGCQYSHTIPK
jgi:hypothetical protein